MLDSLFTTDSFSKKKQDILHKSLGQDIDQEITNPETSTVVGAFTNEVFRGAGSLRHLFTAVSSYVSENYADESNPIHKKLSLEEYQNSPYFREDLKWDEGLTPMSAMLKAENRDRRKRNDIIISNASGGQKALGMGLSVISGFAEPANLASAFITPVFPLATYAKIANKSKKLARATRGATEGLVGQAVLEPFAQLSASQLDEHYTMVESLINIGASSFFGAGFHLGIGKIQDVMTAKRGRITPKQHLQNIEIAKEALLEGRLPNFDPNTNVADRFNPKKNGDVTGYYDGETKTVESLFHEDDGDALAVQAEKDANLEFETIQNDPDLMKDQNIINAQKEVVDLESGVDEKINQGLINCMLGT
jgi:hypothetical protein